MNRFVSMILLLFISNCFVCCDAEVYYVLEDQSACIANENTSVSPCYSLQQLSNGNELLSNTTSIVLFIETGTHIIPENHTLLLSNLTEVTISPHSQKSALVKCNSGSNITFQHIKKLHLLSLNFISCSLLFDNQVKTNILYFKPQVAISQCVFVESKENYAITIARTSVKLNISFSNCKFLSNNGAISCNYQTEYPSHVSNKTVTISIVNTTFLNNRYRLGIFHIYNTDLLEVHGSSFINNTDSAISLSQTNYALITNTSFLSNHANSKGGAIEIYSSSSFIEDCLFHYNSAELQGGAIYYDGSSSLFVEQTRFLNNSASSGGAIFTNKADITRCQFEGNYATLSGGAVYFSSQILKESHMWYSTFQFNEAEIDGGAIYCVSTLSQLLIVSLRFFGGHSEVNKAVHERWVLILAWLCCFNTPNI